MPRPKPTDPTVPVTITLPRSIKRISIATARTRHLSLSAWIAEVLREHLRAVERLQ